MSVPAFRVHGDVGKQVDGGLEHIQPFTFAHPVKAVRRITALHIDAEGFALAVGAALVGMAGDAVFIVPDKYGVVVGDVLIDERGSNKGGEDFPVDFPASQQVPIRPPHRSRGLRQREGLRLRFRFGFCDRQGTLSILTQQQLHPL